MKPELQNAINAFQNGDLYNSRMLVEHYLGGCTGDPDAFILLAAIHAADANYIEVVNSCNRVLEISPRDTRALYNAAVACQMNADHHGVISYTDRLIDIDTNNISVFLMRVISLYETGDTAGSFMQASKILEFENLTPDNALQIIRYYKNKGSYGHALSFVNMAIETIHDPSVLFIEKMKILLDMDDAGSAEAMLNGPQFITGPLMTLAKSYLYSKSNRVLDAISILENGLPAHAHPDILSELAKLYVQTAQYDRAKLIYEDNIRNGVRLAENYHALGNIYNLYDEYQLALNAYNSALNYSPNSEATYYNIALVNEKNRDYKAAISSIQKCPTRKTSPVLKLMYIRLLANSSPESLDDSARREMLSLIEDDSVDSQPLSMLITKLIRQNTVADKLVCVSLVDDMESFSSYMDNNDTIITYKNDLLLSYLSRLTVTNYEFECFIRMLRHYLLAKYDANGSVTTGFIDLCSALSIQCFITGYVFNVSECEQGIVDKLLSGLVTREANTTNSLLVIVLSMYIPVNQLIDSVRDDAFIVMDNKFVNRLLKLQFFDRIQEEEIYANIDSPFEINDETSVLVRNQYEDSPYPVWERLSRSIPRNIIDVLNEVSPYHNNSIFNFKDPDVLIAGCGTGSHVILSSMRVKSKSITAIDLSKRSLAFAIRKSEEYNLNHVKFIHMDILKLPDLQKEYDIIESIGVIHHMKDPASGLNCLVKCLKPGGLLNLALYSSIARRYVTRAKALFDGVDRRISDDEIRSARVKLMGSDDRAMVDNFSTLSDFFSLHECRDLIFHECEHNYRIPDLSILIKEAGLAFIGFDLNDNSVAAAYRKMFPGDDMTNLENWNVFENRYPDTFIGMYNFWCYKL